MSAAADGPLNFYNCISLQHQPIERAIPRALPLPQIPVIRRENSYINSLPVPNLMDRPGLIGRMRHTDCIDFVSLGRSLVLTNYRHRGTHTM